MEWISLEACFHSANRGRSDLQKGLLSVSNSWELGGERDRKGVFYVRASVFLKKNEGRFNSA